MPGEYIYALTLQLFVNPVFCVVGHHWTYIDWVNNQYLDFVRQYLAELMCNQVEFIHFANMANLKPGKVG
jgi:hypothetical protein